MMQRKLSGYTKLMECDHYLRNMSMFRNKSHVEIKNKKTLIRQILQDVIKLAEEEAARKYSDNNKEQYDCLFNAASNLFDAYIGFDNFRNMNRHDQDKVKSLLVFGIYKATSTYFIAETSTSERKHAQRVHLNFPANFILAPMNLIRLLDPAFTRVYKEMGMNEIEQEKGNMKKSAASRLL
jgi:hypothetical protein